MQDTNATNSPRQDFVYAGKTQTKILLEQPSELNPYISKKRYLHGYDVEQLIVNKSFSETLLLLFTGEIPSPAQAQLLERLMVTLIDIGPRHPAVKASMVAGVSKANAEHLLPIGLSVLGGKQNGAQEVAAAVEFIYQHQASSSKDTVNQLLNDTDLSSVTGEFHLCPGFGNCYGAIDELIATQAKLVFAPFCNDQANDGNYLNWVTEFTEQLHSHNLGMLLTGLTATVFCQLGIAARESIGLFQLLAAPGIFAHGVEQTHKPITAMPMLSDEQHIYSAK